MCEAAAQDRGERLLKVSLSGVGILFQNGRRSQDDLRQIGRWRAVRRHVAQLKKHCKPRDLKCRRRQRQALLHWGYDSRKI